MPEQVLEGGYKGIWKVQMVILSNNLRDMDFVGKTLMTKNKKHKKMKIFLEALVCPW